MLHFSCCTFVLLLNKKHKSAMSQAPPERGRTPRILPVSVQDPNFFLQGLGKRTAALKGEWLKRVASPQVSLSQQLESKKGRTGEVCLPIWQPLRGQTCLNYLLAF